MKTIKKLFLTLSAVCLIMACSKDDDGVTPPNPSNEKQITSFQFLAEDNAPLSDDIPSVINESTKVITAIIPLGISLTSLTPEIVVSNGASYSPEGVQDFTSPVIYTVTAEDGSNVTYTVSVTIEENNAKQITSFRFLSDDNSGLSDDVTGIVNETEKTISASVPHGTDVTALFPEVLISAGASYAPEGIQDFTTPVVYTITAENGTTEDYTVTVTVSEISILTTLFNENPGNTLGWDTSNPDISTWAGITTNENGEVIGLNLRDKGLSSIPAEIGLLINLSSLDMAVNNLTSIPTEIGELTNLTFLNLGSNNLTSIPDELWQLNQLTTLSFYDNNLTSIPAEIGQLINLTILNLSVNNITSLPEELWEITSLQALSLTSNSLTSISSGINQLVNLTQLDLGNNNLISIPLTEIGQLTSLNHLNLSYCNLVTFPMEILSLSNLENLDLSGNSLTSLPGEISQLNSLKSLAVYYNNLSSIPVEIGQLTHLTYLSFFSNSLTSIPAEIGLLINLETLDLLINSLTTIPQAVCDLETTHGTTINKDAGVTCTP